MHRRNPIIFLTAVLASSIVIAGEESPTLAAAPELKVVDTIKLGGDRALGLSVCRFRCASAVCHEGHSLAGGRFGKRHSHWRRDRVARQSWHDGCAWQKLGLCDQRARKRSGGVRSIDV